MKDREQMLRQWRDDPKGLVDYTFGLQEELRQARRQSEQTQENLQQTQENLEQTRENLEQTRIELEEHKQKLAQAQALIAELKQELYGPKSEKLTPEQEEQLEKLAVDLQEQAQGAPPLSRDVVEEEIKQENDQQRRRRKERKKRRHMPPVQLEKRTEVLEPEDKICPRTGKERPNIGREVTTEYEFEPAKLIIKEIVRPKYGQCGQDCCQGVVVADLPPRLLPQSKLGLGLAVFLLLSRFDDHVAYYTLERNFLERFGVVIPRQQMVQWVEKIAHLLLGIYWLIWEEMKAGGYLQIDETPVKVLDPEVKGKAATGYLWFYSAPGGDVFLEFCKGRGREGPASRLEGFEGTFQSDAYNVYESLRRQGGRRLKRIGCLGHARRKFYKALQESVEEGLWFILKIRELYRIEDQLRDSVWEERRRERLKSAAPIWREMKQRAEKLKKDRRVLPASTLGKAVSYFLNEYTAMVGYLKHGRYEIDNNLVENDVRPSAVGRKRWLFIGHPEAGWRSAVIYTIIQSCRRRGINPQEYLTDVLGRLPSITAQEAQQLVPSRWKPLPPKAG
jgi:transposase